MIMNRIGVFLILICLAKSELIFTITHPIVMTGDSIFMTCSGTNPNVRYYPPNYPSNPNSDKDIYINAALAKDSVRKGFKIYENQTLNEVNITKRNVIVDDAGEYECIDRDGNRQSAQLTVFEKHPICQMTSEIAQDVITQMSSDNSLQDDTLRRKTNFVGPNSCNIPPDQILVSCSLTYRGNDTPPLEWRDLREDRLVKSCPNTHVLVTVVDEKTNLKRVTCDATMPPELHLDGTQFVCQTKQSAQKQYSCTTDPITVSYAFHANASNHKNVHLGEEVDCTANCSHPLARSYSWTWSEETNQDQITRPTKSLKTNRTGSHRCDAKCQIGEQPCAINAMYIEVISGPNEQVGKEVIAEWKIGVSTVAAIIVICFVVVVGCLVLGRKRTRQTQIPSDANVTQTGVSLLQMSSA